MIYILSGDVEGTIYIVGSELKFLIYSFVFSSIAYSSKSMASLSVFGTKEEVDRPVAKYHPSIWHHHFISFSSLENSQRDSYSREVQVLKQKVRDMLVDNKVSTTMEKITLINSLCRLGVSYHFKEEIEEELKYMFAAEPNLCMSDDYDLYTCALVFMVFRQHGFGMSCDIFNKFKDGDGKFKETLGSDVRGMLGLYEASHLRVHGEAILDEAIVFTTSRLESFARDHPSHALSKQVLQALHQPLFRGIPRLETRRFISFYEEDEARDEMLLAFAKLDFNLLQLLHQQELGRIQKWWKDSNIPLELSYIRDRTVECYFWMLGVYYESHHSRARIFLTKVLCLVTVIDDTYDAYATFEESKLFTDSIQRWEASELEQLPKYMHVLYDNIIRVYEEMEKEVSDEGRSYSIDYAKEVMKELVRSYYKEVGWLNQDYVPQFDKHMETSTISIGAPLLSLTSFVGMKMAGREVFDWLLNAPICVKSCGIIARLMDDLAGHKFELERKHIATTVQCYMAQYGVSEEEVGKEFGRRVANSWKDLNEECLSPVGVSKHVVMQIHKLTRTADVIYKSNKDIFTSSKGDMENYITLLFIEPIYM